MKILLLSVLAVAMIGLMIPSVFAATYTVENAQGSSNPGCEPNCFIPSTLTITVGDKVAFSNTDAAAHTSTAGTPADGPSGAWDSSLVMMNSAYTTPALDAGEYLYFCMVHPWMVGLVIVDSEKDPRDSGTIDAEREARESAEREARESAEREARESAEREARQLLQELEDAKPKPILSFVDPEKDPSHYVKRYINEETYQDWFNEHFPDYTIYEGIGITQEEYRDIVNELTKPVETYTPDPEPIESEPTLSPSVTPLSKEMWFLQKFDLNMDMSLFDTPPETIAKIENMSLAIMYNIPGYDTISESKLNYELNQISGIKTEITNFEKNSCKTNTVTVKKDGTTHPPAKDLADYDHCLIDYSDFKNLQVGEIITFDQLFGAASLESGLSQDELETLPEFRVTESSTLTINGKKVDVVTAIAETNMDEAKMSFGAIIHKQTGIGLGSNMKISSDGFLMEVDISPIDVSEIFVSSPSVGYTPEPDSLCGDGTVMKDGKCVVEKSGGGGCLIATAAFGSEMASQVQFLREIRDNTVMNTQSGTAFMTGFNQFYYSFSPYVADYERENPVFKEAVKVTLTPLITSLTLLNYVDVDTEEEMLGYGIGIILLNVGMYFVAPAALIISLKKRFL